MPASLRCDPLSSPSSGALPVRGFTQTFPTNTPQPRPRAARGELAKRHPRGVPLETLAASTRPTVLAPPPMAAPATKTSLSPSQPNTGAATAPGVLQPPPKYLPMNPGGGQIVLNGNPIGAQRPPTTPPRVLEAGEAARQGAFFGVDLAKHKRLFTVGTLGIMIVSVVTLCSYFLTRPHHSAAHAPTNAVGTPPNQTGTASTDLGMSLLELYNRQYGTGYSSSPAGWAALQSYAGGTFSQAVPVAGLLCQPNAPGAWCTALQVTGGNAQAAAAITAIYAKDTDLQSLSVAVLCNDVAEQTPQLFNVSLAALLANASTSELVNVQPTCVTYNAALRADSQTLGPITLGQNNSVLLWAFRAEQPTQAKGFLLGFNAGDDRTDPNFFNSLVVRVDTDLNQN